ncbi:MAG: hypothetical protein KatS3mg102_1201 [Planctomycetota bacterium]|nr:MAG: hypothetical protein KatS3mg102_1201 [Planctomycetota bacterium]
MSGRRAAPRLAAGALALGLAFVPAARAAAQLASPTPPSTAPPGFAEEQAALAAQARLAHAAACAHFAAAWRAALAAGSWAHAEVYLHQLAALAARTARHRELLQAVPAVQPHWPPLLRARARGYRAQALLALGRPGEAERELAPLGFIERFAIAGPFDNERGGGFEVVYGPERPGEDGPEARYPGKVREVGWRAPEPATFLGVCDLDALLRPHDEALAYARVYLHHQGDPLPALLWIGSDEGLKVWWNDRLVLARDVVRERFPDQDAAAVLLQPGWNELLLKVTERKGAWAFQVRLTDWQGEPLALPAAPALPPEERHAPPGGELPPVPPLDARAYFAARTAAPGATARDWYHLGVVLRTFHAHDVSEHPAREAFARACALAPAVAAYQLALASAAGVEDELSVRREDDPRRHALEQALRLDPECAAAAVALARYYLDRQHSPEQAAAYLERARAAAPEAVEVYELAVELAARRGRGAEAAVRLRQLAAAPAALSSLAALVQLAGAARAQGRIAAAQAWLERALALEASHAPARQQLVELLCAAGALPAAIARLQEGIRLAPFALQWRVRLAELHHAAGQPAAAAAVLEDALAIAPEDAELHERRGRMLLLAGERAAALAAFDRALALDPHRPALRRYLELLRAGERPLEDAWRIELEPVLARARSLPLEPRVAARVLLDQSVVRVERDGRASRFRQLVLRLENDDGVARQGRFEVSYAVGEQQVRFRRAAVIKPDGRQLEAVLAGRLATAGHAASGELTQYARASVTLPPREIGDVVVIEYRLDDLVQSFFGDYFGHVHLFAANEPVLRSRLVLLAPAERELYVHARPPELKPLEDREQDGLRVRIWELCDLAPIELEPDMPPLAELAPAVEISSFDSWDSFARWYWNLIRKQHEVSPEMRAKVRELVAGARTREEKIRAIYAFVAQEVRYNDRWEFGVHGFKPYNAASIFARRFGDCKDKALLINTMLGEVGIEAYPVLVRAAPRRPAEDLALPLISHFNHCISFVPGPGPGGADGWFLDGTAQFHDPESIPGMDAGARVVVVRPQGAELRQVPVPPPLAGNGVQEQQTVRLLPGGGAEIELELSAAGEAAALVRNLLANPAQRREVLERVYGRQFAGLRVLAVETGELAPPSAPLRVRARLQVPRLLERGSAGLQLRELGNPLEQWLSGVERLGRLAGSAVRRHDLLLAPPWGVWQRIRVELPSRHATKSLPPPVELQSEFGRYHKRYQLREGALEIERRLELSAQRVPAERYEAWRAFATGVDRAEERRALLGSLDLED